MTKKIEMWKTHQWTGKFVDLAHEKSYQQFHRSWQKKTYPIFSLMSLFGWILYALVDWLVTPQIIEIAFAIRFGFMVPVIFAFWLFRNASFPDTMWSIFPFFILVIGCFHFLALGILAGGDAGLIWFIHVIIWVAIIPPYYGLSSAKTWAYGFLVFLIFSAAGVIWNEAFEGNELFLSFAFLTFLFAGTYGSHQYHKTNRIQFWQSKMLEKQNVEIELERAKSDKLLRNVLPDSIANKLKEDNAVIAERYNSVSVLFADLVGFTPLCSNLSPEDLVKELNVIFSEFDRLSSKYGLEKIKTIGDTYMVSGGLPEISLDHQERIAKFALEMRDFMKSLGPVNGSTLQIRIGVHSGEVVAGVIGIKKFAYDLWGDTVNTASRMESHGNPGKVHVSEDFRNAIAEKFEFEKREPLAIKGKGTRQTYFLVKEK